MNALVLYDSLYGNTEKIARAIGDVLSSGKKNITFRVGDVQQTQLEGLDLLVVGSPTHAFRPSKAAAAFLRDIPENGLNGVMMAAFDTGISGQDIDSAIGRFVITRLGYAAKHIARRLEKKGGLLILPPEGFFVKGSEGPLRDGEIKRAEEWARKISGKL